MSMERVVSFRLPLAQSFAKTSCRYRVNSFVMELKRKKLVKNYYYPQRSFPPR
jgi:hypothetical protein